MRNHNITRRQLLASGGAAATAALAGCAGGFGGSGQGDEGASDSQEATASGIDESDAAATVGMVYALGGLDDRSFNDAANRGIQRARLDDGVEYTNHEQPVSPGSPKCRPSWRPQRTRRTT